MGYIADILRIVLLLPPESSTSARGIDVLHFAIILTTMFGAGAITLVGIVFCIRYRAPERAPNERRKAAPMASVWTEALVIGGLFSLFIAFWVVGSWQYVELASPPAGAYDIYVSGKQWMWKFGYPDGSHTIGTLYVPTDRPVRLILTSRDVIHSFFVPDFRVKQDAVPGRYTSLWFQVSNPGAHQIFCAEYCGTKHSGMLGQVIALSGPDFERWLESGERSERGSSDLLSANTSEPALAERGQQVAATYGCLRCHSIDGSPHIGPTWAGLYASAVPLTGGGSIVADPAYLTESMMDPVTKVRLGYAPVMPSYLGRLRPGEVGSLVEFIKSLRQVETTATPAPLLIPDGGVYRVPRTELTRSPAPAGGIGQPPGEPMPSEEEVRPTAPTPGGQVNPMPRPPADDLRQRLQRDAGVSTARDGGKT